MVQSKEKRLPEGRAVPHVLHRMSAGLVTVQARAEGSAQPGCKLPRTTVKLENSSMQAAVVQLKGLTMCMPLSAQTTVISE